MGRVATAGGGAVTVAASAASTRDYDASWRGRLLEGKRVQAGCSCGSPFRAENWQVIGHADATSGPVRLRRDIAGLVEFVI
jgi:hypothetical protein